MTTGVVFPENITSSLIGWCIDRSIHFISDEIYALSMFEHAQPFVSAMEVSENENFGGKSSFANATLICLDQAVADYVHTMWGASKDFGLNGLRIGILHTRNKQLQSALRNTAYFFGTPGEIQRVFAEVLSDNSFLDTYIPLNQARITTAYHEVSLLSYLKQQSTDSRRPAHTSKVLESS